MDIYKQNFSKSGLCLNTSVETQPGLEVQDASSRKTWPCSSQETRSKIQGEKGAILERRQIAGLSIGTFWALVVLLCLIVGGGISGGVVAGIAAQRNECKSTVINTSSGSENSAAVVSSTTTSAIYSTSTRNSIASSTTSSGLIIDNSNIASSSTTSSAPFNPSVSTAPASHCSDEFSTFNDSLVQPLSSEGSAVNLSGIPQTFRVACYTNYPSGAQYGNPGIHDIMKIYMPDLIQCMMACAEYNAGYSTNLQGGIDVGGGLCRAVSMVIKDGEFCYLKNGTGVNNTANSGGEAVRKDSAILQ
ncbi:hypothetical protein BELL_0257g00150 [Botrytis elliptica]|uniref:Apple domain-containing protein n=1 Tax=Botrytis elliptica TaxID=278938 RepID=A0A4Z1JM18_9HELO|nr:hypothetical protein EAE99_008396 [Botrytis elliptica]TGO74779.1 hypothetical protein BELL_0257g00150 [Botrytis elliptica]